MKAKTKYNYEKGKCDFEDVSGWCTLPPEKRCCDRIPTDKKGKFACQVTF